MISDPLFYAVVIPAILLVGISKGGFGGGVGLIGTPMVALVTTPTRAAAILLPILCAMDIVGVVAYRKSWDPVNMRILVPGSVLGILLGTATFRFLDENLIRLLIGALALGFVLRYWLAREPPAEPAAPSRRAGSLWATLSGFTSFVAHAGGPPVHVYLLPQRIDKTLYVGTLVVFFTAVNYTKLVPYGLLGQLSANNLGTALILSPLAPVGIWLGVRFHRMLSESLFYTLCFVFLSLTGVKLIWDGLSGMMGG
ncbi:MAG: sulfite exporter TauE/SafE family protein [Alphaproteobacteria bacterium]|nr:sulfite exporter TauE/SafE family protein [Alphaproteobacteria bacterium]